MATSWSPAGTEMNKRSAIFAAAIVVLVLSGAGCGARERDDVAEPSPAVTPAMTPPTAPAPSDSAPSEWLAAGATNSVAEITGDPKAFLGKTVTIVAKVDEIYSPRAFTLSGEDESVSGAEGAGPRKADSKRGAKALLTLVPKVGGFPSVDAQWKDGKARVTGVVQRMAPKNIEREIGWVTPQGLESRFRGRPTLIARSVERLAN
jgi:hypothetical protein